MEKTKIELSEVDVYFLTKGEANLLWDYDTSDSTIWQKRIDFFNSIRKQGRYVLAIDITGIWFYNFFKPKREGEKEYDVYATSIDINCDLRTFNEWIKAKYKEKFEEELCLTNADENYSELVAKHQRLVGENVRLEERIKHLEMAVENSTAKASVDAVAKNKGVLLTNIAEDKDGLSKAQKLIFEKRDPFFDDLETEEEQDPEPKKETDVNNWKAMYFAERSNSKTQILIKDAQFKTLLDLFNSREND